MHFSLPLFKNKKEISFFLLFLFVLFSINLYFKYEDYKKFTSKKIYKTDAIVLNQYIKSKNNKKYFVLKLKAKDGFLFYTTSKEDLKDLKNRKVLVKILTKNISFLDYLKSFYAPVIDMRLYPKEESLKNKIFDFIASSHQNQKTKELFLALFIAKPISKELRERVQFLGVSHLIAISGFHLGVLFFVVYNFLKYFYKFFQIRYFPYRNRTLDLTIVSIFFLFFYISLIDFTPSLIRAFVMLLFGFFLYSRAIKILSFSTLLYSVLMIVALFPTLIFSIGFWFSVAGVFYIYLFLKYFKDIDKKALFVALNFWVFFAMIPIVHYFFPIFSLYQLLSPILSMLFVLFYPVELFLHIIGFGDLLDGVILELFSLKGDIFLFKSSFYFLVFYILISILAIFRKVFFYALFFLILLFFVENIAQLHTV